MPRSNHRWECECGWRGFISDMLKAPNPFDDTDMIHGCPSCKQIGEFTQMCDECWKPATCGTPTDGGYKRLCGDHYILATKKSA